MKGMRVRLTVVLGGIFAFALALSGGGPASAQMAEFGFRSTAKLEITNDVLCSLKNPNPITCTTGLEYDSYQVNAPLTIARTSSGGEFLTDIGNNVITISFYTSSDCSGGPISMILIPAGAMVQQGKKRAYVFNGTVADSANDTSAFVSADLKLNRKKDPRRGTLLLSGSAHLCGGITGSTPDLAQSMQLSIGSGSDGDIDSACQPVTGHQTLNLGSTIGCS